MPAPRKLVLSVDPSALSRQALSWAGSSIIRPDDEVHLVTVLQPAVKSDIAYGAGHSLVVVPERCQVDPTTLEKAHHLLQGCKQQLVEQGVPAAAIRTQPLVACIGSSADIARHIVDYSDEQGCSAVVLGSRGLGFGQRTMLGLLGLGSVSSEVVKQAHCSVMIHKAQAA